METLRMKDSRHDFIFNMLNYALLILILILVGYPLAYVVGASFSSPDAVIAGKVWLWPIDPTLAGYIEVFQYKKVGIGFLNSLIYTVFGTLLNVVITVMAAYALSRKDMRGRNVLMLMFVFTMLFHAGLIPTYLTVKDLGLLDTRFAMILPTALAVWNVIIARTFFQVTIPDELLEAAQIDGSSDFYFFFKIVIPLSAPIIAVLTLFYAIGHWNQYFQALIYLRDERLVPLQIVLRSILIKNEIDPAAMSDIQSMMKREGLRQLLKYSLIVTASLPVLLIYPFVQKHFVKGVMIGSLKG